MQVTQRVNSLWYNSLVQFTGIMHMNPDAGIVGLGYKHQLFIIKFYELSKAVKSWTAQKLLI